MNSNPQTGKGLRWPISVKIFLAVALVVVLQSILMFVSAAHHQAEHSKKELVRDVRNVLTALQQSVEFLVARKEFEQLQKTVTELGASDITRIAILVDDKGKVLASTRISQIGMPIKSLLNTALHDQIHARKPEARASLRVVLWESTDSRVLYSLTPVRIGRSVTGSVRSDRVGMIFMRSDMSRIFEETERVLLAAYLPMVFTLLLFGLLLAVYFHVSISRRIHLVNEAASGFAGSSSGGRISIHGNDEITDLGLSFNRMAARVYEQHMEVLMREKDLHITLDSIGDAVIATDAEGMITRMNPVAEKLTGWSEEQARSVSIKEVFPIVDATTRLPVENPVDKVLATGQIVYLSNHTTLISKNAAEYQIADSAAPIKDDNGDIVGMVLVFNDVTEQYRLREEAAKSQRDLQAILDFAPAAIYVKDREGRLILINRRLEELFNLDRSDIVGKTSHDIFPAEFADEHRRNDMTVFNTGVPLECEEQVEHADGIHCYMSVKFPLYRNTPDGDEEMYAVCGISTDITERKQAEEEIGKLTRRLQEAQRISRTGSWELDLVTGRFWWSDEVYRIFGAAPGKFEATYEAFLGLVHPDERDEVDAAYKASVNDRTQYDIRHRIRVPNDGTRYVREVCKTEYSNEGLPLRSMGTVQDITEQVRLEESLRRTQKMDALGKLTGGVAHDYNNMLGIILGYADMLASALDDQPKLKRYVEQIAHAGERGEQLTKKLLSFSRRKQANADCVVINDVLRDEQHMLEKTLTARIGLRMDLAEDLWPVWMDAGDLEDAVVNMSINAQHAIEGEGELMISTRNLVIDKGDAQRFATGPGEYVELAIRDTGMGIPPDMVDRIFDPFYTSKGDAGTGLGLSQVYGFVKLCDGTIEVESEQGKGTTFRMLFPRYIGEATSRGSSSASGSNDYHGEGNILVVDDEAGLRLLAEDTLESCGYTVFSADGGDSALEILANENIDLVISDIIMPGMNGYQLAAEIRRLYPGMKIQMVSGYSEDQDEAGVDPVLKKQMLRKPYDKTVMLKRVCELLKN